MDSHVGLDYIVDNPDYCVKLASALDAACPSVKKQVVELLSALCVYSQDGRQRAVDTLHAYQERKGERYRLRVVVEELRTATTEDYQTALLAFVNCLVISTPVLKDRIRIRNEFIGLKILPILSELRKSDAPDLRVQLDVFDDQRETDEELSNHGPPGIDLSSHVDVFYAILGQIADTPQEIPFLSILQHLLRLDPKDAASDLAWDTAETLVHRATLLESREDATKLLRSPSLQANLCCHCRGAEQTCGASRKASLPVSNSATPLPPLPPLPPPPPPLAVVPPSPPSHPAHPTPPSQAQIFPPPPPPLIFATETIADAPMEPPMPPPLRVPTVARAATPEPPNNQARLLPQQEIPTPKTKMKTINWNKIPNHKVIGKRNIWSLVADEHQNSPMTDLDWAEMEGLFCQQAPFVLPPASCSSSHAGNPDAGRGRREPTEIVLLDGKRSLNVNIFLKQFRSSNEDIIRLIEEGGHDDVGAEKLRGLLKILPEVDELEMLKGFDGDKQKLGNAEKFFLQLIQVPNYKLRIECMLLKEEFAANMGYLEPSINSMILAGEDLMTNKPLQEVLYMVLVAGNFLNSGGYAGNAAGVKLSSLQKLTEIRANKPGMNLIHYVALQVERKRKDLLNFAKSMSTLEAATKTTIEQLNNEFNTLDAKIKRIKSQIRLSSTETDIQEQMAQFLQMAEREMAQLKRDTEELESVRRSLAEFFCEDANTFKIEECFKVFHQFCQKFGQAVAENERRRIQEEQVLARRRQREEQLLARKRMLTGLADTPGSESECNLTEYGLAEAYSGSPQRSYGRSDAKIKRLQNGGVTSDEDVSIAGSPSIRRRLASCCGGPEQHSAKEDACSPDVTPNGTLRRRRSRIPCEDDDGNLMDFLRTSGQDGSRERKSWGSLDRSWARRARGQSRRGDLLNADFSGDRERPSSPSPLAENKPFPQEEEAKPTGKAWRQKIEAWLSENEKEDRAGEQLQRRARQLHQVNRRSFEDSESEGKTSTTTALPEGATSVHEGYSEVYDWRPSVEKTDVMRTMEAVEEAQPHATQKDKSPWRKSSLNVPNGTEETDPRYSRRLRSRLSAENVLASGTLQAIEEEERKRSKISDAIHSSTPDELTVYLRQPYSGSSQSPVTRRFSKLKKNAEEERISDKIDIDSDNIETPPASRKLFVPAREVKPVEKEPCKRERCNGSAQSRDSKSASSAKSAPGVAELGTGNFDRYSATRRTRRYKKTQDSGEREARQDVPSGDHLEEKPVAHRPRTLTLPEGRPGDEAEEATAPRGWLERIGPPEPATHEIDAALAEIARSGEDLRRLSRPVGQRHSRLPVGQPPPPPVVAVTNTVLSPVMQESRPRESATVLVAERAVTSRERQRSMIDPSQVKEAIRLTNNPPSQVSSSGTRDAAPGQRSEDRPDAADGTDEGESRDLDLDLDPDLDLDLDLDRDLDLDLEGSRRAVRRLALDADRPSIHPSVFREGYIPDLGLPSSTPLLPAGKNRDQEMNDEGFEETQSLVSETLSQETSSGNYETDTHDSTRYSPAEMRRPSSGPAPVSAPVSAPASAVGNPATAGTARRSRPSFGAFASRPATGGGAQGGRSSLLPKRSTSSKERPGDEVAGFGKRETPAGDQTRNEVERSGSRSSLRSSRSSLNSATSVNTVRNLAPSHAHLRSYTSAIRALTNDLRKSPSGVPLPPKDPEKRRTNPRSTVTRIPASRSSSSGSSVGPVASVSRTVRRSASATSDASKGGRKESRLAGSRLGVGGSAGGSGSGAGGSAGNVGQRSLASSRQNAEKAGTARSRLLQPRVAARNHSFMRPTAASANKGSIPNLPRSVKGSVK